MSRPQPRGVRSRERGSALAAMTATLLPIVGLITAFFLRSSTELRAYGHHKATIRATHRALSSLEIARNEVINSAYSTAGNERLRLAWAQTGGGSLRPAPEGGWLAFDTGSGRTVGFTSVTSVPANVLPYRLFSTVDLEDDLTGEADDDQDKVSVWVVRLTPTWYMLETEATVESVTRTARVLVRERDPFTRFSIFIDNHYQGIGGSPKGDIHTNRTLQIFFPDAEFDDYVSARDGIDYLIGADPSNTTYNAGSSAPAPEIPMPDLNDIQAIQAHAQGDFYVGSQYDDVSIVFDGDEVTISAVDTATGNTVTLHDGALPANGVIYAENDITTLEGTVNGRVTVATEGDCTITNSLVYVDDNGEHAMINADDPANYAANPDYTGSSSFGVIANGPVLYDHGLPDDFELNGAVFSSTGNVGIPGLSFTSEGAYVTSWDPSFQKDSMAILGSVIADRRFVGSVVDWSGNVLSGFQDGAIQYDRGLLNNPPPHFLEIDRPLFKATEIVENVVDI